MEIFALNMGVPAYIGLSLLAFGFLYLLFHYEAHPSNKPTPNLKKTVAASILTGVLIRTLFVFPVIWAILGPPFARHPQSGLDILFLAMVCSVVLLRSRLFKAQMKVVSGDD